VASEYKGAVSLTALSRILLYFLGALLRCHVLVQDMLVQIVCNSGLGLLAVGLIDLFAIHPALPVAVAVGLLVSAGYLMRIAPRWHSKLREILPPEQQEDPPLAALPTPPAGSPSNPSESLPANEQPSSPLGQPIIPPQASSSPLPQSPTVDEAASPVGQSLVSGAGPGVSGDTADDSTSPPPGPSSAAQRHPSPLRTSDLDRPSLPQTTESAPPPQETLQAEGEGQEEV
jgi:hypothetical protein